VKRCGCIFSKQLSQQSPGGFKVFSVGAQVFAIQHDDIEQSQLEGGNFFGTAIKIW
jgi:hypothetical protein